jgi:hypothetical protein
MQCALNPSPVVIPEVTDAGSDIINILLSDFPWVENYFPMGETGFRGSS